MIGRNQVPEKVLEIVEEEIEIFRTANTIEQHEQIPDTSDIPIKDKNKWIKVVDPICVYIDMIGSTKLSATSHDSSTASAYQLFTNTAIRIFHEFDARYIDVQGDGVFALYNKAQPNRALAAAVTFKTFVEKEFQPRFKDKANIDIGTHIGIDMKTLLVRKLGMQRKNARTDRQNEVWAGKTVNMAAKLASLSESQQLIVSDRYFSRLKDDKVLKSCDCNGSHVNLWKEYEIPDDGTFDFSAAFLLESCWCEKHGQEYCADILALDE